MFGKLTTLFRREERAGYTDAQIQAAQAAAITGPVTNTAAVFEAVVGAWARGFAAGESDRITTAQAAVIGRALCAKGESVWLVRDGALVAPASTYDIVGGHDPMGWRYRLDLSGPSGTETRQVHAGQVFHARINVEAQRPWRGRSPFSLAPTTCSLMANLERQLGEEASGPMGYVLPVPKGNDGLAGDIKALAGGVAVGESMTDAWGGGPGQGRSGAHDWEAQRFGANPPAGVVQLRGQVEASIAAAAGVPADLVVQGSTTEALRESWRQFAFGTLMPLALEIGPELRAKVGGSGVLSFDRLAAADVQGRARAYKSLRDAGMDGGRAATVTGF